MSGSSGSSSPPGRIETCPCGSEAAYAQCCGPLHDGAPASTALALMRSRFSAYALGRADHVRRTWHPSTRPAALDLDDGTVWRRLQIVDAVAGGPDDPSGVVEFRASYRDAAGRSGLLAERSSFARGPAGEWLYVDGETR